MFAFEAVTELYAALNGNALEPSEPLPTDMGPDPEPAIIQDIDEVVGQQAAKRALMIAAAGGHNILLNGPPGTGKTMLARSLPGIMPDLAADEILEVTHLHSLAGKNFERIITRRPFRAPHHTASTSALIGGGAVPRPGEVSLSHLGILFMDELPEFRREIIESMRLPLEDGLVSIVRAGSATEFPARFLLVAASNPCPCGFFGSGRRCECSQAAIRNYQKKLSGPIIDRIDLHIDIEPVQASQILTSHNNTGGRLSGREMADKIAAARQLQMRRGGILNSRLGNKKLRKVAGLTGEVRSMFDHAANRMRLSARAYIRTLRVARTIADLECCRAVSADHLAEALQYRRKPPGE